VGDALNLARVQAALPGSALTPATAQALLAYAAGRGRSWLLAHREERLLPAQASLFASLLERAASGEPLAYLLGEREFCGLRLSVSPDVLIPRPETEGLVEAVVAWLETRNLPSPRLVDVGAGSGAIALALAVRCPRAQVTAVEISRPALEIAALNVARHGAGGRVGLIQGSLLDSLSGPFDVIAANLPYINREELSALEVGRWEPCVALDGGLDGLDLVRDLLSQAPRRLAQPGLLVLEIGFDQGQRVAALCREAFPAARVALLPDLARLDRMVRVETS
jgi:release factor glutamine methyltransferase